VHHRAIVVPILGGKGQGRVWPGVTAHPAGTSLCDSREANEASGSANFGDLMHLNAFDMKRPPFLKTFSSDFKKKNYIKYE
jgi:hypothetical protein